MMGRQDGQIKMIVVDLSALIPADHLLKRIDQSIDFEFLYELMMPYYSNLGRRSIDPVSMVKMLLVGYLFGVASERRLVQEVQLNIAYRWFCGFGIDDEIPEHSMFSQNRRRKWRDSDLFEQIFLQIVRLCIEAGLVDGEEMVADGSFIPSNVSRGSWVSGRPWHPKTRKPAQRAGQGEAEESTQYNPSLKALWNSFHCRRINFLCSASERCSETSIPHSER